MNVMGRKKRVVGTKCTIALITIFVAGVVWYLGMRNFSSRATTAIVRKIKKRVRSGKVLTLKTLSSENLGKKSAPVKALKRIMQWRML